MKRCVWVLGVLFLLPSFVMAQAVSARLEGIVEDPSKAVVPGVTVIATNSATNISYESVTNEVGRYVFVALPPGTYSLTAELPGFKKTTLTDILLQIGDARTVNVVLQPGDLSENISVVAETPLMDLTTSKIGAVVESRQILELPLLGRNAMSLFYLQAGTNPLDAVAGSQQQRGGVDGLAPNTNNTKVEGIFAGIPSYDYSPAQPAVPMPQEAVGEYRVTTSGALADAGRGSGAQVSVFLKSGSNEFHGSVFEFARNTVL
ncbi:MAG: carboxypeptidase regulatory-like domain-containing protein, partial [Acidobacteria bacterium]|nr:carboxypeptidase regulatory-like domain-containing protein [Acidobacteriota bacterium]